MNCVACCCRCNDTFLHLIGSEKTPEESKLGSLEISALRVHQIFIIRPYLSLHLWTCS